MADELVIPGETPKPDEKETPPPKVEDAEFTQLKARLAQVEAHARTTAEANVALQYALAEEQRRRPVPQAAQPSPQGKQPTEEELRELARLDPYAYYQHARQRDLETLQSLLGRHSQNTLQLVNQHLTNTQSYAKAESSIQSEYPEVYHDQSPLFQETGKIYWYEMSEWERQLPNAQLAATERAAGRLGLAPRSRRARTQDLLSLRAAESDDQNVGRGSRRPAGDDETAISLNQREQEMATEMGIDPKVMRQAKGAREKKQNVRVP